jgi:hypothetical protein
MFQYTLSFSRGNAINVIVTNTNCKGSLNYELFKDGSINPQIKLSFKGGHYLKNFPPHEEIAKALFPILPKITLSQFFESLGGQCQFFID